MTDRSTKISLGLLLVAVSLFIFFMPWLLGHKQPAIDASVKQNMEFLNEMVEKYVKRKGKPPGDMNQLVLDARNKEEHYNKTFFNPLFKSSGDAFDQQVITVYSPSVAMSIDANFSGAQYAGKTGYFTEGSKYVIYGHTQNGALLTENGQILSFGNY